MSKPKRRGAPVFRPIHCEIWTDDKFAELSTNAKLTFIYLLTNARTTPCGVYPVSIRQGAYETGLTQKQFQDTVCELVDRVRIGYDNDTNEVCIINWSKYNGSDSPKWTKAVEDSLAFVKSSKLREIASGKDTVCIPYAYPMHTLPNRERERERDRDTRLREKYSMPTLSSEVYHLAEECGVTESDIDAWFDYHEARGWKGMKHTERSVKASLRTWGRNRAKFGTTPQPNIPTQEELEDYVRSKWPDRTDKTNPEIRWAHEFLRHYTAQGWYLPNKLPVVEWKPLAFQWIENARRQQ